MTPEKSPDEKSELVELCEIIRDEAKLGFQGEAMISKKLLTLILKDIPEEADTDTDFLTLVKIVLTKMNEIRSALEVLGKEQST